MLPSARSLEGKHVPQVIFKTRANHQWKDVTTDDLEAYFGARKAA